MPEVRPLRLATILFALIVTGLVGCQARTPNWIVNRFFEPHTLDPNRFSQDDAEKILHDWFTNRYARADNGSVSVGRTSASWTRQNGKSKVILNYSALNLDEVRIAKGVPGGYRVSLPVVVGNGRIAGTLMMGPMQREEAIRFVDALAALRKGAIEAAAGC